MYFMNKWDIESAVQRHSAGTIQGDAARLLHAHMETVNSNSDGWAYWKAPVSAARQLMVFVSAPVGASELTQREVLKRALVPLKSFYTKHPTITRPDSLR
jgi:hypothetical protein